MKNILIRGKPSSGKTTLIIKIVNSLKARNDIEIFDLNVDNRERLVGTISKKL